MDLRELGLKPTAGIEARILNMVNHKDHSSFKIDKSKPRVIAFVGLVGSGKSTQIKLLDSELRTSKLRVKTTFLKTGHFLAYILQTALARILFGKKKEMFPIGALIEYRPALFRRLFKLWLILDFVGIFLRFLFTIYLPVHLGYTVLVEEYIPATISDYMYLCKTLGVSPQKLLPLTKVLRKMMCSCDPTQVVFLDAQEDILESRWKERGSFKEKADYLQAQRTSFLSESFLPSFCKVFYINTSYKTRREVHEIIMHRIALN